MTDEEIKQFKEIEFLLGLIDCNNHNKNDESTDDTRGHKCISINMLMAKTKDNTHIHRLSFFMRKENQDENHELRLIFFVCDKNCNTLK